MKAYKATRPDGTDFRTGTVDYGAALGTEEVVKHPRSAAMEPGRPSTYLSVSREPVGTLVGGRWPCRLFRVETVGPTMGSREAHPMKIAALSLRVVEELPSHLALGPQGEQVAALIDRAGRLSFEEAYEIVAARAAARDAAWAAAWAAARAAARDAAWVAVRAAAYATAARDAAYATAALTLRDLIGTTPGWDREAYDILTRPWRTVIGPIHPDDPDLRPDINLETSSGADQ